MGKSSKNDDKKCINEKKKGVSGVISYARPPPCPPKCPPDPCPPDPCPPDPCPPKCPPDPCPPDPCPPDPCPPKCLPDPCPPDPCPSDPCPPDPCPTDPCPPDPCAPPPSCPPKMKRIDGPFGGRVICPNLNEDKSCQPVNCESKNDSVCKMEKSECDSKPKKDLCSMPDADLKKDPCAPKVAIKEDKCNFVKEKTDKIDICNEKLNEVAQKAKITCTNVTEKFKSVKEEFVKDNLVVKCETKKEKDAKLMSDIKKDPLEEWDTVKNKTDVGLKQKQTTWRATNADSKMRNFANRLPTLRNFFKKIAEFFNKHPVEGSELKDMHSSVFDKFHLPIDKQKAKMPDPKKTFENIKKKLKSIEWKSSMKKFNYKDPIGSMSGIMSSGGPSRPMKYPYTYSAKIAQFPMKFYMQKQWIWRYYAISIAACLPVFYYIHKLSNSPGNVAKWAEIKRKEALEHH